MLWKRSFIGLRMAAVLSRGSFGVAFAGDSGADFAPVPQTPEQQTDVSAVWA
jgi:hypothetical protein